MARFTASPAAPLADRTLDKYPHRFADPFAEVPIPREERDASKAPRPRAAHAPARPLRSDPNPRDQTLSKVAYEWWRSLPAEQQPHELCLLYPRVANRLALCWNDAALTEQVFIGLLIDRRGGRRGFPKPVLKELLMLREMVRLRLNAQR